MFEVDDEEEKKLDPNNDDEDKHERRSRRAWSSSRDMAEPRTTTGSRTFNRSASFAEQGRGMYENTVNSWTDYDKAPKPFSSPYPAQRQAQKKYGYGTLLRGSSMDAAALGGRRDNEQTNHFARKSSAGVVQFSDRGSPRRVDKRPSFSRSDFPPLSPAKTSNPSSRLSKQISWSNVVGGKQIKVPTSLESSAGSFRIPPPPLVDEPEEQSTLDLAVHAKRFESEENCPGDRAHPRQRPRSLSFQHSHPGRRPSSIPQEYHPFCSFTTTSVSALQNDIGTLLARSNLVDEAVKRYKLAIESAIRHLSNREESSKPDAKLEQEWPKVTEAQGLAWYRQKLLRGDVLPAPPSNNGGQEDVNTTDTTLSGSPPPPFQPSGFGGLAHHPSPGRHRSSSFSIRDLTPSSSRGHRDLFTNHIVPPLNRVNSINEHSQSIHIPICPSTAPQPGKSVLRFQSERTRGDLALLQDQQHRLATHHRSVAPLDDIVHGIHQHQRLDCNGLTPLGLEYIVDPLPVLGTALHNIFQVMGDHKLWPELVESISLVSARLNLASLEYRQVGGGADDELERVLSLLRDALESCNAASNRLKSAENDGGRGQQIMATLKSILHSNIGTATYRMNKFRDASECFRLAVKEVTRAIDRSDMFEDSVLRTADAHEDNRFPPRSYLLLVTRLNLSRSLMRLNEPEEVKVLCKRIIEENKPHRRASAMRIERPTVKRYNFHRSDSYFAASTALDSSSAAYDHHIGKQSEWLCNVAEHYILGMIAEQRGGSNDCREAKHHYNRLLSLARVKLDHRHPYICTLLERRGAVLFVERKLQSSILSYLACLRILEHQQSAESKVFNRADLSRVLYAIARVLHDKEELNDALRMYQRALICQRSLAEKSLQVITTLCNISRVHHLSGDYDEALTTNKEAIEVATSLVGGKLNHPFLIHRLKVEGNLLVEAGRLGEAMHTFADAARRCSEDEPDNMISAMIDVGGGIGGSDSQEDAHAGDCSVLTSRSASALAQITTLAHPAAAAG